MCQSCTQSTRAVTITQQARQHSECQMPQFHVHEAIVQQVVQQTLTRFFTQWKTVRSAIVKLGVEFILLVKNCEWEPKGEQVFDVNAGQVFKEHFECLLYQRNGGHWSFVVHIHRLRTIAVGKETRIEFGCRQGRVITMFLKENDYCLNMIKTKMKWL